MSKYAPLWEYIAERGEYALTFAYIERVLGFPVDHAFLSAKKELCEYGYKVGKISLKNKTVELVKLG